MILPVRTPPELKLTNALLIVLLISRCLGIRFFTLFGPRRQRHFQRFTNRLDILPPALSPRAGRIDPEQDLRAQPAQLLDAHAIDFRVDSRVPIAAAVQAAARGHPSDRVTPPL